jgi:uncharacterized membrane protein YqjE
MAIEPHEPLTERLRRGTDEVRELRGEAADIVSGLRTLASKEGELARAELGEQLGLTRDTAIFGGLAALLAFIMLIFAAATLMLALAEGMALWGAALLTTVILAALAAAAGAFAWSRAKRISVVPKRTINSVTEDVRWVRSQLNLNGR